MAARSPARRRLVVLTGGLSAGIPSVVGYLLCLVAMAWFARKGLWRTVNSYDEGILVSNADAMLHGRHLYGDVYANYAPGAFAVLAGLFSVFGKSILVSRILGLLLHVALGALAGRLAARAAGGVRRFSWFAAGVVSVWSILLLSIPFAWLWGLVFALGAVDRVVCWQHRWTIRRSATLGVIVGLVGVFRHEIFIVGVVTGCGLYVLYRVTRRGVQRSSHVREFGWIAAVVAMAATLAVGWGPFIAQSGLGEIYRCVVQLQVDRILPGRRIPLPNVFASYQIGGVVLPGVFVYYYATGIVLVLGSVPVGLVFWLRGIARRGSETTEMASLVAVGGLLAVAAACVPQLVQRADPTHVLYAVPPALILVAAVIERWWSANGGVEASGGCVNKGLGVRRVWSTLIGAVLIVAVWPSVSSAVTAGSPGSHRLTGRFGGTLAKSTVRRDAAEFLASNTKPNDMVWSGCVDNRRVSANELDLYFLADRRGGSRWMQYDPGLQDSELFQRRIITDLDRNRVRAVVLAPCAFTLEPNASAKFGSSLLDNWTKQHFRVVGGRDGYRFLLRSLSRLPSG